MKRLFIAVAAAVSMVLAGVVAAGQGEGATTRAVADPSKLTICHETGSASNPWRRISVSSRAMAKPSSRAGRLLRAHLRHRGDAIVVGTAPCPSVTDTPAPSSTPPARITICHNTGSESNRGKQHHTMAPERCTSAEIWQLPTSARSSSSI